MIVTADEIIASLELQPHIEGGYFRETYRCQKSMHADDFPPDVAGERSLVTSIYFLLRHGQHSKFHKLHSDEIWFYHAGAPVIIHTLDDRGEHRQNLLGSNMTAGERPQVLIPAGLIFGAELPADAGFSLVSCVVAPGFDYRDFILCSQKDLLYQYPQHTKLISRIQG